jgi:FAD dependent oxidoreductase
MYSADVIVVGGGSAGVAAAVSAARTGSSTILIEKNGYLGGTATASLVTPMMPNQSKGENLTEGLYQEVLEGLAQKYTGAARFSDNNPGWINPELMKSYLDEVCIEAGVKVFFNLELIEVQREGRQIRKLICIANGARHEFVGACYIDASGNADLSYLAGLPMLSDPGRQAISLRFLMAGIDLAKLAAWIQEQDPEMKNSAVFHHPNGHWMLTTAHTLDGPNWVLRPYFEAGMAEGLITRAEAVYFQIFSVPGMPGVVSFNCPRIETDSPLDPLSPEDISYAYLQGRKQINRYVNFCKAKLPGFENSFLMQIASQLGIRESRRIRGRHVLTDEDILSCSKFPEEVAARCSYPIDIHQASPNADKGGLQRLKEGDYYEIPMRCLEPEDVDNLLVAGRCISASFVAQSSLRIQAVCWALGESAGRTAAQRILAIAFKK